MSEECYKAGYSSFQGSIHTITGSHAASYPNSTGGSLPWGTATGTRI